MTVITSADGHRMSYSEFVQLLNSNAIPARELTTDHLDNIFGLLLHAITKTKTTAAATAAAAATVTAATTATIEPIQKETSRWKELMVSDTMVHLVAGGNKITKVRKKKQGFC